MINAPHPGVGAVSRSLEFARPASDRWQGLLTLIRARLLVATLALPIGVLMRPEPSPNAWLILCWALLAVGGTSALFWFGVRVRRGIELQTYAQVASDLAFVTVVSAFTGGRDSQFVPFFALVVITGGLLARLVGGLVAAAAACTAVITLPWIAGWIGSSPAISTVAPAPPPGMVIAYLALVGILSGVLGERVRRTRDDLERTARELDRVRVDNDALLRHLTTGVLTVDGRGGVAYLNPAAEQFLGLRALDCRGRSLDESLPERLTPLRDLIADTLYRRAPRVRDELMLKTASGRALPLGISTNLLMHEGTITGVVAVFQDLTEVREMERRARRNETLAEVGALSARIAHELRNGLNPISGSVECLQRELKVEGENAMLMELIVTECIRLNRFVTDLLNYSRERDLAFETLELEEHLTEFCDGFLRDPRCGSGMTVRFERRRSSAWVRADRDQIRQVWLNLAINAVEAVQGTGTLIMRWHEGDEGQRVVEFADDGPGIAADELPRVGQPFYTTKKGGTGLGLAIAQRIVERHGGTLILESTPARGTVARVTLPGASARMAQAA